MLLSKAVAIRLLSFVSFFVFSRLCYFRFFSFWALFSNLVWLNWPYLGLGSIRAHCSSGPFQAICRDPLLLALGFASIEDIAD